MNNFKLYQYYGKKIPKYILTKIGDRLGRNIVLVFADERHDYLIDSALNSINDQTVLPDLVYLFLNDYYDISTWKKLKIKLIKYTTEEPWELYANILPEIHDIDKISFLQVFDKFGERKIESVNKNLVNCDACYFKKTYRRFGVYGRLDVRYWNFSLTGAFLKRYIKEFSEAGYNDLKIIITVLYSFDFRNEFECNIITVKDVVYHEIDIPSRIY